MMDDGQQYFKEKDDLTIRAKHYFFILFFLSLSYVVQLFFLIYFSDGYTFSIGKWAEKNDTALLLLKIFAGLILSYIVSEELKNGLTIVHHSYSQEHLYVNPMRSVCLISGETQIAITILVQINILKSIYKTENFNDLIKDFTCLVIITEIDNYFGDALKQLNSTIKHTLSDSKSIYFLNVKGNEQKKRKDNIYLNSIYSFYISSLIAYVITLIYSYIKGERIPTEED